MLARTSLVFALAVSAIVVVACSGTYNNTCGSLGGQCVSSLSECGETLPQYTDCGSAAYCCIPKGDSGVASTAAASSTKAAASATTAAKTSSSSK